MPWYWDPQEDRTIERPMVTNRPEFLQGEFRASAAEEPVSKPRPRAADDFEEIRKRMQELERMKQATQEKPATPVTIPIYQDFC